jgi:hypothetical protein
LEQSRVLFHTPDNGHGRGMTKGQAAAIIDGEQSAVLRDRLMAEIGSIASAELAANWAREALAAKNKLVAPDAKLVEDAFEQRLSELASAGTNPSKYEAPITAASTDLDRSDGIDKSVLAVAAPRRYRTGSTFALSPSSHASSAVAGRLTRIIFVICSRAHSAARPAMNSPYRSVGFIIARCIALATSELGGRRPESIRSK